MIHFDYKIHLINLKDISEKSALHKAAAHGHESVVYLLVNNGANVNAENVAHETVLMSAAEKGNEKIVEFLIEHGAEVFRGHCPLENDHFLMYLEINFFVVLGQCQRYGRKYCVASCFK